MTISGGGLEEDVIVPLSGDAIITLGKGTKEGPFTVGDVFMLDNPDIKVWGIGYVVGFANGSLDKAVLGWLKCWGYQHIGGCKHR